MKCPLCGATNCGMFFKDGRRSFYACKSCELLFVPEDQHISHDDEKKRYDLHDNNAGNKGYVEFLGTMVRIIEDLDPAGLRILDFGCGRNAVLSGLLEQKGIRCDSYDPLYGIGSEWLHEKYDILILCEVVEHLRNLRDAARSIKSLLHPNGKVIVRTRPYPSVEEFRTWWYKEDMTHINFFSGRSIEMFAMKIGCDRVARQQEDIFVLKSRLEDVL